MNIEKLQEYWNIKNKLSETAVKHNLTDYQLDIMLYLGEKQTLPDTGRVSSYFNRKPSVTSQVLKALRTDKGLIEKSFNPKDERKKSLELTSKGKELYDLLLGDLNEY
jgi:DNA-binding MarR family transcriptional regulator